MTRAGLQREADDAPERPAAAAVARAPVPGARAQILQLQQSAGNAAVARMLQRQAMAERELDKKWTVGPANVDEELAKRIFSLKKIAMTFYVEYKGGKDPVNDAEFIGASADFAKTYQTLGVAGTDKDGAKLSFGKAIKVESRDEVTQAITSVSQTIHALAHSRPQPGEGEPPLPDKPLIETIAIFAHGEHDGLGIDPKNSSYTKAKHLKEFVGAIRPHVAGNVRFLLFACSAGGAGEAEEKKDPMKKRGGGNSFAKALADELGGEAEVFAHNIAGHTESNPLARRFTAGDAEGQAMFEVLYGDAFIGETATVLRSHPDLAKFKPDELTEKVRTAARAHYYDAVATDFMRINSKNRHFSEGGYGGIGAAMFMEPEKVKVILREDFQKYWLDEATIKNGLQRPGKK